MPDVRQHPMDTNAQLMSRVDAVVAGARSAQRRGLYTWFNTRFMP